MGNSLNWALAVRRNAALRFLSDIEAAIELWRWRLGGQGPDRPVPALVKRRALLEAFARGRCVAFVETGTFLGDTTYQFARRGVATTSIEVQPMLADAARRRFAAYPNVRILQGDSGALMRDVVASAKGPTLFWLDGHYSGGPTGKGALETPVVAEVETILKGAPAGSVVLVDDARCFGRLPDYPPLQSFLDSLRASRADDVRVVNDSICFSVR